MRLGSKCHVKNSLHWIDFICLRPSGRTHFNHRGESEFMFLSEVYVCKSGGVLSFLNLFEAEYIDLSRVLALLGINKKNISQKWF